MSATVQVTISVLVRLSLARSTRVEEEGWFRSLSLSSPSPWSPRLRSPPRPPRPPPPPPHPPQAPPPHPPLPPPPPPPQKLAHGLLPPRPPRFWRSESF